MSIIAPIVKYCIENTFDDDSINRLCERYDDNYPSVHHNRVCSSYWCINRMTFKHLVYDRAYQDCYPSL